MTGPFPSIVQRNPAYRAYPRSPAVHTGNRYIDILRGDGGGMGLGPWAGRSGRDEVGVTRFPSELRLPTRQ